MNKIKYIFMFLMVTCLLGCQNEANTEKVYCLKIKLDKKITLNNSTKSKEISVENIYAIPFNMEGVASYSDGLIIKPSSISNNVYHYYFPSDKADIFFTSIANEDDTNLKKIIPEKDNLIEYTFNDNSNGLKSDFLYCLLTKNLLNLDIVNPLILKRAVGQISAKFILKDENGDQIMNIYKYYKSVSFKIKTSKTFVQSDDLDSPPSYKGEIFSTWEKEVKDGDSEVEICDHVFIFPSKEENPEITLTLITQNKSQIVLKARMDKPIELNKHYPLILKLTQSNDPVSFIVEDIIEKDISITINSDDIIIDD
ncbi:MAG: hypothetical protein WC140_05455 [Bacteroidales bacterium]